MYIFLIETNYINCKLTDDDANKVQDYAAEHNITLEAATQKLYFARDINLYHDMSIDDSEIEIVDVQE